MPVFLPLHDCSSIWLSAGYPKHYQNVVKSCFGRSVPAKPMVPTGTGLLFCIAAAMKVEPSNERGNR